MGLDDSSFLKHGFDPQRLYNRGFMSLITRCPACRTMFKVVPDQLKISEGWVRCGKCEEIFDARAHMQDGTTPPVPVAPEPTQPPTQTATPRKRASDKREAAPKEEFTAQMDAGFSATDVPMGDPDPDPDWTATPPVPPPAKTRKARKEPVLDYEPTETQASDFPANDAPDSETWPATMVADSLDDLPESAASAQAEPSPTTKSTSVEDLSFMQQARQKARRNRPWVRGLWIAAFVLLGLGLLLQLMVQERDRIVAREPGLRPLVETVCGALGCEVRPWRQIDALVIDSSAFSKVKGDLYRLSVTLKNNEAVDLAMPSVELALTDALDRPLIRRVIRPEELGVRDGLIRAAAEYETTVLLTVKTNGSAERIAGYRLFTFYP